MSSLDVAVNLRQGDFGLEVDHSFPGGSVTAIVGPNGSGKTTLLEAVAGLLPPTGGQVKFGETVLSAAKTEGGPPRRWRFGTRKPWLVPPHRRGTVLLSQQSRLFPHLTVRENIAFGPRVQGRGTRITEERVGHWAFQLAVDDFLDRYPQQLSGGQQQRVSLARALAAEPKILLLDEPTSELDVSAARSFRRVLAQQLRRGPATILLVTHSVEDIVELADHILVLEDGKIADAGPARERMLFPRCEFVARLVGVNRLAGTLTGDAITFPNGFTLRGKPSTEAGASAPVVAPRAGWAAIDPSAVRFSSKVPVEVQSTLRVFTETSRDAESVASEGEPGTNRWEATILNRWAHHDGFRYELSDPKGLIAHRVLGDTNRNATAVGDRVQVSVNAENVRLYR